MTFQEGGEHIEKNCSICESISYRILLNEVLEKQVEMCRVERRSRIQTVENKRGLYPINARCIRASEVGVHQEALQTSAN